MLAGPIRDVADSIIEFEPQFYDKIANLVVPPKSEGLALTRSQFKTLILLLFGPARTATELGEAMDMTKASMTGILDVLESKALATRTADTEDRRRLRIALTDKGREFCESKMVEFDSRLEARMSPLSNADRTSLARHLAGAAAILKKL